MSKVLLSLAFAMEPELAPDAMVSCSLSEDATGVMGGWYLEEDGELFLIDDVMAAGGRVDVPAYHEAAAGPWLLHLAG